MFRRTISIGVIAGVAGAASVTAAAPASAAGPDPKPICARTDGVQYAANYAAGGTWKVSGSPLGPDDTDGTAYQTAEPSAVGVTAGGGSGYADSGVIRYLGKLSSLFDGDTFDPAKVAVTGQTPAGLGRNLYFDTNGNHHYLSFSWDGYYQSIDGDNIGVIGNAGAEASTARFSTFPQDPGPASLSGTLTMAEVRDHFAARTDGGDTDPDVWEWAGATSSGGAKQANRVTSIGGVAMPTCSTALEPVARYRYSATNPAEMWTVYNTGPYARDRSFYAYAKAPGQKTQNLGQITVKAGSRITFWSDHGGEEGGNLYISYWDGMGQWAKQTIYSDPAKTLR